MRSTARCAPCWLWPRRWSTAMAGLSTTWPGRASWQDFAPPWAQKITRGALCWARGGCSSGWVAHVAGTRILAVFGAPVAQEDHARRAVLAAWGLQQRLAALRDTTEEPLAACHLGLHTGLMVVGEMGVTQRSAIFGDLTLTLDVLHEHAAPGMLICSEATAGLVRKDVDLKEVAPVPVRGRSIGVRTYQVVRLRS